MEDQIGIDDSLHPFRVEVPRSSDKVCLERAHAVPAKVIARIDETPSETTRSFGEPRQLHGKEVAQDDPGPKFVHERTDSRQGCLRPRRER
jgi:hypothetical protein